MTTPPADPGRPTPREAIAKVTAAAGPRVAKAVDAAAPKVEKAAVATARLLGTLRDRAKETAKGFGDGYTGRPPVPPADGPGVIDQPAQAPIADVPVIDPAPERPRPRPTPRRD